MPIEIYGTVLCKSQQDRFYKEDIWSVEEKGDENNG